MEKKNVKAVILKPNSKPYVSNLEDKLETYQGIVGGYIDVVELDNEIDIVVNDEGLLYQLKPNIMHPLANDEFKSILVGNCIFVSHDNEGNFVSLNREQISRTFKKIDELRYKLAKYTYEVMKRRFENADK